MTDDQAMTAPTAESTDGWASPYRIDVPTWNALVGEVAPRATAPSVGRVRRTARGSTSRAELPEDARSAWAVALARAGRLGQHLGEGRYALLCINDHQHSQPDGSVANARGGCVLLPPIEGSVMGRPHCSHAHCAHLSLEDWVRAVTPDVFAEALCRAQGWRFGQLDSRDADGYLIKDDGIFWAIRRPMDLRPKNNGDLGALDDVIQSASADGVFKYMPGDRLAYFSAVITANILEDYGTSRRVLYEVACQVGGRKETIRVPADAFASMAWSKDLGADAIIMPGRDSKDHVRAAIQISSRPIPWHRVFAYTGWAKVGEEDVYVHAGGAIGARGAVKDVEVLGNHRVIRGMKLPEALKSEYLLHGLLSSIELMSMQPKVTIPLFGAVWRAAMGGAKLAMILVGKTARGKTLRAALAQSYFGAFWTEKEVPVLWKNATAASIIQLMATAGDCLFLVDDFMVSGDAGGDAKFAEKVDVVTRAVVGGGGSSRLNPDGSLQAEGGAPRSILVTTAESMPRGHSLRSRFLVLTVEPDEQSLDRYKEEARAGIYAGVMAAFVRWFAPRKADFARRCVEEVDSIAGRFCEGTGDRRTAEQLAHVALGVGEFIEFAKQEGVPLEPLEALRTLNWQTLQALASDQHDTQDAVDPVVQFQESLAAALRSGAGYLSLPDGKAPHDAHLWGWEPQTTGSSRYDDVVDVGGTTAAYRASGDRIGYLDTETEEVWLIPDAALGIARRMCERTGTPLAIGREDLPRRLDERGILLRNERKTRGTWGCRRRIGGKVVGGFLVLRAAALLGADQTQAEGHDGLVGPEGQVTSDTSDTRTLQ